MINVVCVKWGDLYNSSYVNKLYNGVVRNTTKPFKFICFTENPVGILPEIEIRPFIFNATGWWNKIYLFSAENGLEGRIFYLDLDTVIIGNIDIYMQFDGEFAILRDMYHNKNPKLSTSFGSGIMGFEAGYRPDIWTKFKNNPQAAMTGRGNGDQGYLMREIPNTKNVTFWQDVSPKINTIVSYKVHIKGKDSFPNNASIVVFHGLPRPKDCENENWMKKHWR